HETEFVITGVDRAQRFVLAIRSAVLVELVARGVGKLRAVARELDDEIVALAARVAEVPDPLAPTLRCRLFLHHQRRFVTQSLQRLAPQPRIVAAARKTRDAAVVVAADAQRPSAKRPRRPRGIAGSASGWRLCRPRRLAGSRRFGLEAP